MEIMGGHKAFDRKGRGGVQQIFVSWNDSEPGYFATSWPTDRFSGESYPQQALLLDDLPKRLHGTWSFIRHTRGARGARGVTIYRDKAGTLTGHDALQMLAAVLPLLVLDEEAVDTR